MSWQTYSIEQPPHLDETTIARAPYRFETAHLLSWVANDLAGNAQPTAGYCGDGDPDLRDKLENEPDGKRAGDGVQDREVVECIGSVVDEPETLERYGHPGRDEQGPQRLEHRVLSVKGRRAPPGRPDPPAHGRHDGQHETVADLIEELVRHAAFAGGAGGAAIGRHADTSRVAQVGDAENDLLGPAARERERNVSREMLV